eukprot:scaffold110479_cov31-Tisochrysis_lutea.AAC.2
MAILSISVKSDRKPCAGAQRSGDPLQSQFVSLRDRGAMILPSPPEQHVPVPLADCISGETVLGRIAVGAPPAELEGPKIMEAAAGERLS